MIKYKVEIDIKVEKEENWRNWMKETHIRDVVNTGCFYDFNFQKINYNGKKIPAGYSRYEIEYFSESRKKYDEYDQKWAPTLQAEHSKLYEGSFKAERMIYDIEDVFENQ
jgi:hypothetical protein